MWNGRYWEWDENGTVLDLAESVIKNIYVEAAAQQRKKVRELISSHAAKSESRARIEAMLTLAQGMPAIRIDLIIFDQHPLLFNCSNGTVDLKIGNFREFRRDDFLTKISSTVYDETATCPLFLRFLTDVTTGRPALADFLQRAAGYSLTGLTDAQVFFLLTGGGGNGKSTLVNLLVEILGPSYAQQIKAEVLLESKFENKDVHLAELDGIRLATAAESDAHRRLSTSLIKQTTSGEMLVGRRLYESPIRFKPQFKLWFSTNHEPQINDSTESIWRRIRKIPFDAYFPEDIADLELPRKLTAESSGILNWMIAGCSGYLNCGLQQPEEVRQATAEYRQNEDLLGGFIAERCVFDQHGCETLSALYDAYQEWCANNNEEPLSKRQFGQALSEKGILPDRTNAARIRRGLRLRSLGDGDE